MKYNFRSDIDVKKARTRLEYLISKGSDVELKELKELRSNQQNRYIHVLFALYGMEFGYSIEEAKTHLKRECEFMRYEKGGEVFLKHTSKLDTKELSEFTEWIRNYAGKNGLYLLTPDEYRLNRVAIDNEIEKFKEFL